MWKYLKIYIGTNIRQCSVPAGTRLTTVGWVPTEGEIGEITVITKSILIGYNKRCTLGGYYINTKNNSEWNPTWFGLCQGCKYFTN